MIFDAPFFFSFFPQQATGRRTISQLKHAEPKGETRRYCSCSQIITHIPSLASSSAVAHAHAYINYRSASLRSLHLAFLSSHHPRPLSARPGGRLSPFAFCPLRHSTRKPAGRVCKIPAHAKPRCWPACKKAWQSKQGREMILSRPSGGLDFLCLCKSCMYTSTCTVQGIQVLLYISLAIRFLTSFAFIQPILALFPHSFFRFTNTVSVSFSVARSFVPSRR